MNRLPSFRLVPDDRDDERRSTQRGSHSHPGQHSQDGSSTRKEADGRLSPGASSSSRRRSGSPMLYPTAPFTGFVPHPPPYHPASSHEVSRHHARRGEEQESVQRPRLATVQTIMTRNLDRRGRIQLPPLNVGGGEAPSRSAPLLQHIEGGDPRRPLSAFVVPQNPPFLERTISAPAPNIYPSRPSPTAHRTFPPFAQSSSPIHRERYQPLPPPPSAPPSSSSFTSFVPDRQHYPYYPNDGRGQVHGESSRQQAGGSRGEYIGHQSMPGPERFGQSSRTRYEDTYQPHGGVVGYDVGGSVSFSSLYLWCLVSRRLTSTLKAAQILPRHIPIPAHASIAGASQLFHISRDPRVQPNDGGR